MRGRQSGRQFYDALEFADGRIQIPDALGSQSGVDMLLQLRRNLQRQQQGDYRDHSGSFTVTIRSTATFCRTCFVPPGQTISTVGSCSDPNPKCTRPSLAERQLPDVVAY